MISECKEPKDHARIAANRRQFGGGGGGAPVHDDAWMPITDDENLSKQMGQSIVLPAELILSSHHTSSPETAGTKRKE